MRSRILGDILSAFGCVALEPWLSRFLTFVMSSAEDPGRSASPIAVDVAAGAPGLWNVKRIDASSRQTFRVLTLTQVAERAPMDAVEFSS